MAVRTLGFLPRKLAMFAVAVFLCQSASAPLLAGGGGQAASSNKAKANAASEQALSAERGERLEGSRDDDENTAAVGEVATPELEHPARPRELRMLRARSWNGDLRMLPQTEPVPRERPEREGPDPAPRLLPGGVQGEPDSPITAPIPPRNAPAPPPSVSFDGLDFANFGAGHPPDTNGDVGPNHYIQTINTSIGIFNKTTGVRTAAFTFDTFMSQGNFGNVCDTENFGDPVVLYDTFEDRWVITDFAFVLDGGNNVVPPALQCLAVSKTGDPVLGGWNFYSIETLGALGDYPKFGVWPDGIYMSANMFSYPSGGSFQNARVWAFNKAQMYAGAPAVQVVTFNAPAGDFAILPSNARLQTGTPPPGTPNYFISTWEFLNALTVYKFHVDWQHISLSSFTGPDIPLAASSWPNAVVANAPSLGGNTLDVLQIRAMMQNQYAKIGGVESLWTTHTVRRANATGFAAPRWYQVTVTGGTVAPNIPQAATWDPDGANVLHRFVPSLAVNRNGDMALGYSTSSATTKPAINYAARLVTDPINTFSQTEQLLIQGTGTQTGNCGGSACSRWGDYSAMTLDPDGCTFWYTNEYYAADGLNHQTRIGAFALPCTTVGSGTLTGTVTDASTSAPLSGATVSLGSRTTTTNPLGVYSFIVPAGTYPSVTASFPGYNSSTFTSIVVPDAGTTTQDFALSTAPAGGCITDTTQSDFQAGVATNCDLTTSPGDVILLDAATIDQQNPTVTNSGFGFNSTAWAGQTFRAGLTGNVARVDLDLFCSGCTGTTPNLTVAIRATAGSPALPTGPDLATATIAGFNSGAGGYFTANFASPFGVTAGTTYAVILRAVSNPSAGVYAYVCSCTSPNSNPYVNGQRVTSADSGGTWVADVTSGGRDLGFRVYVKDGFEPSGTFMSSTKDANPAAGMGVRWTTLSWTAATPAGTDIKFQAAASNNAAGPFTFVGPDGTAATFFTVSGASLAQFNQKRYLKYQAFLSSSSSAATPTLNDVSVCFEDVPNTTTAITSDTPDPSVYGAPVAVTYTVTPNAASGNIPTGNVTVTDGVESCTGTVASGGCSLTLHTLGLRTLTATYGGDANFFASPPSVGEPHTVIKANTTAAITLDDPDPSVTGQSVPVNYSVSVDAPGTGTPTGTVTVSDGVTSCTGTLPALSCSITLATAGPHSLTATYSGDLNFNASPASAGEPHLVNKADTTASITADPPDPSAVGQAVAISYTVSVNAPGGGTPTGNVTVTDGTDSCVGTVATGGCSITFTSPGTKTVTATYAGDANYNVSPASAGESHIVGQANTTTAITGDSPDPSVIGQAITVSYTVTPAFAGTPTGNVTVSDGVDSCTGTVATGSCSLTLFTVGSRPLTATYAGDSNFNASTSAPEPHTVGQASTTAAITSDSPDPSVVAQPVTITYTVSVDSPGSGTPTGNVTVTDGTDSCTGTVALGTCTITFSSTGLKTLTATYAGDASYSASPPSAGAPHTVVLATTTTAITSTVPNPSLPGQLVTINYTVTVNPPGTGTPTGNVTVTDGVLSCTATVAAGSCTITFVVSGPHLLTATYEGDANFATSTSAPFVHNVRFLNDTAGKAKDVLLGSVSTDTLGVAPDDHNWFRYAVQAGRSYCVEVDNGKSDTSVLDPFLSVYHADGTTLVGSNDNVMDEPAAPLLSRVCYIAVASEDNLADVTSALGGGPGAFRVRVVDTTIFSPWFFASSSFETFILIKNTTGTAHNVTVTLQGTSGAPAAPPQSGVAPADGSYNLQLSVPPPGGFGMVSAEGGVLIAHDGPPGVLASSVVSISFTTGVSFDTPGSPRQDYRR